MFGEKVFAGVGYPTPVSIPETNTCLTLKIPASDEWWAVVVGLLYSLILEFNWQQFEGGLSREAAAARWQVMLEDALEVAATTNACGVTAVETPYWDNGTDIDDTAEPANQTWYGYVENPDAPANELTIVEQVGIWTIDAFLLYAGDIGAAIAFNTIAPRFVLAWHRGDVGEIFRVVIDSADYAVINTSSAAPGDIINSTITPFTGSAPHDILIVKTG